MPTAPPSLGSPSTGMYLGSPLSAPTPTPYGSFTGPNPASVASDPYYQFRAKQGEQAIQRSAAAHGTLLNGGTLKALEGYRQGLASEEAGKAFDRALASYNTNRDTNAQNFGESHTAFGDNLAGFNASTAAGLGYGRLGLDAQSQSFDQAQALQRQAQEQALLDDERNRQRAADAQAASDAFTASARATPSPFASANTIGNQVAGQALAAKIPSFGSLAFGTSVPKYHA